MAIKRHTVAQRKKAMLEALEKTLGIITTACEMTGIGRRTVYNWLDSDPKFRREVEEIENIALDFAESQLHKRIKAQSDTAIIFYLKTKGKHRGYIERTEQKVINEQPLFDIVYASNDNGTAEIEPASKAE